MLKILQFGSPILEKPAQKVENLKDPKVLELIENMLEVLEKEQDHSAGLSAPQVGKGLRIAIIRRMDIEEDLQEKMQQDYENGGKKPKKIDPIWEVMINPEITYKSSETSVKWEGCLSINQGQLFGQVRRPKVVKVKYFKVDGSIEELTADGYLSHIVQHEIDHLDGVLFLKYIADPTKLYTSEEIDAM